MLRTHAIALPLLLALTLTGCGSPPVALEPEPTPEELAYDEALAVYTRLIEIVNEVALAGGDGAGALREAATEPFVERTTQIYAEWMAAGHRQVGLQTFRDFEVWDVNNSDSGAVIAAVCDDVSGSRVVDAIGDDVTKEGTQEFFSLLTFDRDSEGKLLLDDRAIWNGASCPGLG